jgi:hypothetical protein
VGCPQGGRRAVDPAAGASHPRGMQIHRRGQLLAEGYTDSEVRRKVRSGEIVVVRRGTYVAEGDVPRAPGERHALDVRAAVPRLASDAVVSHVSAAALHGLPLWGLALDRVHVTRPRVGGGRVEKHLHVYAAPLVPEDIALLDGIAVTAPARTVVDLARQAPFEVAVAVADAALYAKLVTPDELDRAVGRAGHRPGVGAGRRAVRFANGSAESVGESRSRVLMRAAGLPTPELQRPIRTRIGVVRTDFAWPEQRVVGEFDGVVKYGSLRRPGQDPADVVVEEKRREDAIRDEGWHVTRWLWRDLDPFDDLAARLAHRLS